MDQNRKLKNILEALHLHNDIDRLSQEKMEKQGSPQLGITHMHLGGASWEMVIVAGIGHGDTSSNPGLIAFHIALIPLGKV